MGTRSRPGDDPSTDESDDPPADESDDATPTGVRAELAVHGLSGCPLAAASNGSENPITGISWSRVDGRHTEEFRVRDDDFVARTEMDLDPESVIDLGAERVYRYARPDDPVCACRIVESLDVPVADTRAENGVLYVTVHLPDLDRLRDVVSALGEVSDRVAVQYLLQGSGGPAGVADRQVVDRGRLTERQREVLRTAYRMGYFERPRDANASTVADALDISASTFAEHLAVAQRKLLEETLTEC